jgi:translation initiation factor IF-1
VPGKDVFEVEGTVRECLQAGLYRVEFPNGHRVLAYATRRKRESGLQIGPGERVTVELSPFDLSKGRLK